MASDLNAKHVEWNSRLITKRGRILRDYADRKSCLIYGSNTSPTLTYNPSATTDVLHIAIAKDLGSPLYQTTRIAPSSDHLHNFIDTLCRSSFLSSPDRPDLRRNDWPKFQSCLEAGLPSNPYLPNELAIEACVKELSNAISKALTDTIPKYRPRVDPRLPIPARIQDEIRLKNRLRRQ